MTTGAGGRPKPVEHPPPVHLAAMFLLSAVLLALQVVLVRILSIVSWHHFAYFVISTALLGFGVSGTVLAWCGRFLERRFQRSAFFLCLLLAFLIPFSLEVADLLPIDARYVMYSREQAGLLAVYFLLMLLPFLSGATAVGLALFHYAGSAGRIYGANLLGSGFGSAAIVLLLFGNPPHRLLFLLSAVSLGAALLWVLPAVTGLNRRARVVLPGIGFLVAAGLILVLGWRMDPPRGDPYKQAATLQRLAEQGDATHIATRFSPRARLDLYASPLLHNTLFAGLTAEQAPPGQYALLADGNLAGTVFRIADPEEAEILDHTPQSLPYRLYENAEVLLLGETGGTNVWLARHRGAKKITVVQPNPQVVELVRTLPDSDGGRVFRGDDVHVVRSDPRRFLENTGRSFDIIQLCEAEGMSAASSGLLTLHENRLLTVEGLDRCLDRLKPGGVVAITRGNQSPPRDNPRILATFIRTLERRGTNRPGDFILQAENYLATVTLVFLDSISPPRAKRMADGLAELGLEVDHLPEIVRRPAEAEGLRFASPADSNSPSYHAARLLSPGREEFMERYGYDLRPPTDNRPYFFQFFRWRSLPLFLQTYGRNWMQKLELGYVIAALVFVEAVVLGALLILLPSLRLKRGGRDGRNGGIIIYFAALGFGYLFIEMVTIQRLTLLFGSPVYATAFTLAALLGLSGIGSFTFSRKSDRRNGKPLTTAGIIAALVLLVSTLLVVFLPVLLGGSDAVQGAVILLMFAPLFILMGRPFPAGLEQLQSGSSESIPLAWGVNGFASVAASPLAVMIAVSGGFYVVSLLAGACYLIASLAWMLLPERTAEGSGGEINGYQA